MATEKLIAGSVIGATWTDAVTASVLNSLAANNVILSDTEIDNSNGDLLLDVSVILGSLTPVAPGYIGVYLMPKNSDASTYGDNRFGSAAAGPGAGMYFLGAIQVVLAVGAQYGTLWGKDMPLGKFKLAFENKCGATWPGSGANTAKVRTANRSIV